MISGLENFHIVKQPLVSPYKILSHQCFKLQIRPSENTFVLSAMIDWSELQGTSAAMKYLCNLYNIQSRLRLLIEVSSGMVLWCYAQNFSCSKSSLSTMSRLHSWSWSLPTSPESQGFWVRKTMIYNFLARQKNHCVVQVLRTSLSANPLHYYSIHHHQNIAGIYPPIHFTSLCRLLFCDEEQRGS